MQLQGQDGIQLHSTSAHVVPHLVERLKADASGTYDQQQLLGQAPNSTHNRAQSCQKAAF
jgi:hypothetical protein